MTIVHRSKQHRPCERCEPLVQVTCCSVLGESLHNSLWTFLYSNICTKLNKYHLFSSFGLGPWPGPSNPQYHRAAHLNIVGFVHVGLAGWRTGGRRGECTGPTDRTSTHWWCSVGWCACSNGLGRVPGRFPAIKIRPDTHCCKSFDLIPIIRRDARLSVPPGGIVVVAHGAAISIVYR